MASREQLAVLGWMTIGPDIGQAWPGVLLHRDALLVRAPIVVLGAPQPNLQVVIDLGGQLQPGIPVAEVLLFEIDGYVDDPATAMLRLAADAAVDVSVPVNRGGFDIALRVTGDAWKAAASLGLVPDSLSEKQPKSPALPGAASLTTASTPASIRTVPVQPDGWCDVFWWLC